MIFFKEDLEQKFLKIYQENIDEIYRYVYLHTGLDETLAEDLSQDIFLDVYKGLSGFNGLSSPRTWVFQIAKNKVNDFYRRQYRQKAVIVEMDDKTNDELFDPKQDMDQYIETAFNKQNVRDCLNQLPQQYKITLLLKYVDDKSVKQIAQIAGKSPKAIESMLQRAKKLFIKQYQNLKERDVF